MSDFDDAWLALRAPADSRARADRLALRLGAVAAGGLDVVDLGCGTGANLRHLAPLLGPRFGGEQRWLCIDRDPGLLAVLPERLDAWANAAGYRSDGRGPSRQVGAPGWRCRVETRRLDLAADLQRIPLPTGGLVTASALLDLVSADWLAALLARCADARCPVLIALTYDGRCSLDPPLGDDALVIGLVDTHQQTDKGFGPALGPRAAAYAAACCGDLGYSVETAASDWVLGPDQSALQRALLEGWLDAAAAMAPEHAERLQRWARDRRRLIDSGVSRIRVGHQDVCALP
jgi:SAM-dependent methyltransferase